MIEAAADWEPAFAEWLKPFLEALGHKTRQRWAPVYVRGHRQVVVSRSPS